jgi:hypothetical protein
LNIYLAGPVDLAPEGGQQWKVAFQNALMQAECPGGGQWTLYDPSAPWGLMGKTRHDRSRGIYIERVNMAALKHCQMLVGCIPKNIMSIGTPIEIDYANRNDKPIVVATDIPYGGNVYLMNRVEPNRYVLRDDPERLDDWMGRLAVATWKAAMEEVPEKYPTSKVELARTLDELTDMMKKAT